VRVGISNLTILKEAFMRKNLPLKLVSLTTFILVAAFAGAGSAHAARFQTGPAVFDYSDSDSGSLYTKKRGGGFAPSESSCYIEPTGFHNSIRWDSACVEAMKHRAAVRSASASVQPRKFVEPRGFHSQIRWTD
jgi:hypothetical protein